MAAVGRWLPMFTGTDHTWENLAFIREHWDGPILLKGIQHVDDAKKAADAGMSGIVVSNHGGRQVDGAVASLDACPASSTPSATGSRCCSTPASAPAPTSSRRSPSARRRCFVGRPWVYGLALGGYDGVRHVLRSLLADIDISLGAVRQHHARRSRAAHPAGAVSGVTTRRDVVLLGSTGSIGTQAIDVVEQAPDRFRVVALAAGGSDLAALAEQAARLRVRAVGVGRADAPTNSATRLDAVWPGDVPQPPCTPAPRPPSSWPRSAATSC